MKRTIVSLLLAVLLLLVALPAYAQTPTPTATPTSTPTPTPLPTVRFAVRAGINLVVDPNGTKYWVEDGVVDLPVGTWYAPLIANGTLTLQPSTLTAGNIIVTDTITAAAADITTLTNDFFITSRQAPLAIADGTVISPTGSYQPIYAAGAVSTTLMGTGYDTGTWVTLVNTSTNAITLADQGAFKLSGDLALGQFDNAILVFDGTYWVLYATANN